jgi:hypothetical protein
MSASAAMLLFRPSLAPQTLVKRAWITPHRHVEE